MTETSARTGLMNVKSDLVRAGIYRWLLLLFFLTGGRAFAADHRNLLANSDLAGGSGATPNDWSPLPQGATTGFEWRHNEGTPAELMLDDNPIYGRLSTSPYWAQEVDLEPG